MLCQDKDTSFVKLKLSSSKLYRFSCKPNMAVYNVIKACFIRYCLIPGPLYLYTIVNKKMMIFFKTGIGKTYHKNNYSKNNPTRIFNIDIKNWRPN